MTWAIVGIWCVVLLWLLGWRRHVVVRGAVLVALRERPASFAELCDRLVAAGHSWGAPRVGRAVERMHRRGEVVSRVEPLATLPTGGVQVFDLPEVDHAP